MKLRNLAAVTLMTGTLMACGGTVSVNSIFAGDAPITAEDYVGKTFPIQYVGRRVDGSLFRSTGTVRFIDETSIEVDLIDTNEVLDEVEEGVYVGPSIGAATEIIGPELTGAFGTDEETIEYYGFLGFETPNAGMPTEDFFFYDNVEGGVLILSDGVDSGTFFGDVLLDVDFSDGGVSGRLFLSEEAEVTIVGSISGNGISGTPILTLFGPELPTIDSTINGEATGTFFGQGATTLAGTYEGTGVVIDDSNIDFVGAFAGIKSLPDL